MPASTPTTETSFRLADEAATRRFARTLAARLSPGDSLLIEGGLGAGKTTLVRAAVRALCGEAVEVPSPSYTLVQTYEGKTGPVWHFDLYRLSSPAELEELNLREALSEAITFIEWPDRLGRFRPRRALTIELRPDPEAEPVRHARLSAAGDWPRLAGLADG
jgi:tRNA threonylcarbamoyladenosine biosynthesis protein TsaE